jgi:hypothetical protein
VFDIKINSKDLPIFDKNDVKMISKEQEKTMNNVLLTIQNSVAIVTPVGATGAMRASLKTLIKKMSSKIIGIVGYGAKYTPAVNDGRKAAPVSQKGQVSLRRWIQKSTKGRLYFSGLKNKYPKITLKQATFLLARSLKNKKREGQRFFEKGLENAKADINRIIKGLGTNIVKGLLK